MVIHYGILFVLFSKNLYRVNWHRWQRIWNQRDFYVGQNIFEFSYHSQQKKFTLQMKCNQKYFPFLFP